MADHEKRLPGGAQQPFAIFLMGPTASGKTNLAIALAKRLPVDVISVDSALVYRDLNTGTAKPGAAMLRRVPHRLIDIREPTQPYSAAEFREDALLEMEQIVRSGRIPLLVGGTMLYFRALERGLAQLPPADPSVREAIERDAVSLGWKELHERLARIDPEAAARIHPNDPQRIQRALEVHALTGEPMTRLLERDRGAGLNYRLVKLALAPPSRSRLHQRIEQRFMDMLEAGFVEEVRGLRRRPGMHPGLPAMRAVGYRQIWRYLDGEITREEMIRSAVAATRQLAKRQMTWLRSETRLHWVDPDSPDAVEQVLKIVGSALTMTVMTEGSPSSVNSDPGER